MTPLLDAHIVATHPGFELALELTARPGEVVALLGPNGSGKTTALRAIAGLHPLSGGHIRLDGAVFDAPAARRWLPPEERRLGLVFQDYLLFPHLSVRDNVAFGLRCQGLRRAAARQRADDLLAGMGLAELARRRPGALSGGQAQRVALARALAVRPRLLLLDEPLAALDAQSKLDTRVALQRQLAQFGGATVLVTHDPLDAVTLADRLVIVENGAVVQQGDVATVTAHPRSDYVARLVGLNLYRGQADGDTVRVADGLVLTVTTGCHGPAWVTFAPGAVSLFPTPPAGSPRNCWPATVTGLVQHGGAVRVQLTGPIAVAADVTTAAVAALRLAVGQQVWVAVKATETRAYPA